MDELAWQCRSSRSVVRDRWINLRADECLRSDGGLVAPYYVLEYSDWVSVLAVTDAGDALVVREYRHAVGEVASGLPGGGVEDSDADPTAAAIRELREETGYTCREIVDLGWTYANWATHTNRVHHFLARGCEKTGPASPDRNEQIVVDAVPLDELVQPGFLRQSFHAVNVLLAQRELAVAPSMPGPSAPAT